MNQTICSLEERKRLGDVRVGTLYYTVGTQYVYVTVISREGVAAPERLVSVDSVIEEVGRLTTILGSPTRFSPRTRREVISRFATDWGRRLLPGGGILSDFDVLIIVPHQFLHGVPLQLIRREPDSSRLGETFGLTYCSSITQLLKATQRNRCRREDLGSWEFPIDGSNASPIGAPAKARTCAYSGIDVFGVKDDHYQDLAALCAAEFEAPLYMPFRSAVKLEKCSRADAICLVCHGVTDSSNSDNSGLLLGSWADGEGVINLPMHLGEDWSVRDLPFADVPISLELPSPAAAQSCPNRVEEMPRGDPELLSAGEVATFVETQAELVLLLGCSTAAGEVRLGDSYTSLAYQWLHAGAVTVVGHQWEVDLSFVTLWAPRFLGNWLRKRQPKAIAAREALSSLLEDASIPAEDPYIWGPMVVLGDWL